VADFTQKQQATLSTVEGEAWALLQARNEANHRGLNRVQFESGTQVLTKAIQIGRSGNLEFGNLEFSLAVVDIIQIILCKLWNEVCLETIEYDCSYSCSNDQFLG
jgi:hypothetical protein